MATRCSHPGRRHKKPPKGVKRTSEYNLETDLWNRFRLTLDDYEALLEEQDHACAICGAECSSFGRLSVDHNHKTGHVRGLLCRDCNVALGIFHDSEYLLRQALSYLIDRDANPRYPGKPPRKKAPRKRGKK